MLFPLNFNTTDCMEESRDDKLPHDLRITEVEKANIYIVAVPGEENNTFLVTGDTGVTPTKVFFFSHSPTSGGYNVLDYVLSKPILFSRTSQAANRVGTAKQNDATQRTYDTRERIRNHNSKLAVALAVAVAIAVMHKYSERWLCLPAPKALQDIPA